MRSMELIKTLKSIQHFLCLLQMKKAKIWQKVQPLLKTDDNKVPSFNGQTMLTTAGPVQATQANASIS